jgi:transcriptional regulator
MRRRDLWALGLAALEVEGQESAESLYIPKAHLVEDRNFLHGFMDEFPFVDLVTASSGIRITHIPVMLDRSVGRYGSLYGHIARQNPQSKTFDGQHPAVIVFRGPHSYISPTWYANRQAVPSWNFAVVHASGKLKPIDDDHAKHDLLARLIDKFEYNKSEYDFAKLPDSYKFSMIPHIVWFQMELELIEGKFKLGQERTEADRQGILKGLETARKETSIHDLTASFYRRISKPTA